MTRFICECVFSGFTFLLTFLSSAFWQHDIHMWFVIHSQRPAFFCAKICPRNLSCCQLTHIEALFQKRDRSYFLWGCDTSVNGPLLVLSQIYSHRCSLLISSHNRFWTVTQCLHVNNRGNDMCLVLLDAVVVDLFRLLWFFLIIVGTRKVWPRVISLPMFLQPYYDFLLSWHKAMTASVVFYETK